MRKIVGALAFFLLMQGGVSALNAQNVKIVSMEKFVSKCLYNFSWYVNWPEENRNGEFIFGVVGNESVYDELISATKNKKVGLQQIKVVHFKKAEDINQYCHVLYLSGYHGTDLSKIKEHFGDKSILFVTEREGMTNRGSAINFVPDDGIMKFEICKSNAEVCGLQMSSRLENMAFRVL